MDWLQGDDMNKPCTVVELRNYWLEKKKREYSRMTEADLSKRIEALVHSERAMNRLWEELNSK